MGYSLQAYQTSGLKDPRWDDLVRHGLTAFHTPPRDPGTIDARAVATAADLLGQAYAAGCRDPIVIQFYAVASGAGPQKDPARMRRLAEEALEAYRTSKHPAVRKFGGHLFAFHAILSCPNLDALQDDLSRLRDIHTAALALWPEVLRTPKLPGETARAFSFSLLANGVEINLGRAETLAKILPPFQQAFPDDPAPRILEGITCLDLAYEARGGATADKVPDYGWRGLERGITQGRKLLDEAWRMDPTNPMPPTGLLFAEIGRPQGRDVMETWFRRAMNVDPTNLEACSRKIQYLRPRWYGSVEDLLAFGHECLKNPNWGGKVPLVLVTVHQTIASDTSQDDAYFRQPQVWTDIQNAFELVLKRYPADLSTHCQYLALACQAEQWSIAQHEAKIIGSQPDLSVFGSEAKYRYLLKKIAASAANTTLPAMPRK